jgi:metal-sulfur cluster biosynthetic enzyme
MTTSAEVREALTDIIDPCSATTGSNLNIVEMGLVKSVSTDDGEVAIQMHVTSPVCTMVGYFREEAEAAVGALDGVESVTVETDAGLEWHEDMMTADAQAKRQEVLDRYDAATDRQLAHD